MESCYSAHCTTNSAYGNYLTADFPVGNFTIRAGYLNSYYNTDVNGIQSHIVSHSFLIGFVKNLYLLAVKKLKKTNSYNSAYYWDNEKKHTILPASPCVALAVFVWESRRVHFCSEENFEALWKIMDEHYCFFEYKDVDWNDVYARYSVQVTDTMKQDQFIQIVWRNAEWTKKTVTRILSPPLM